MARGGKGGWSGGVPVNVNEYGPGGGGTGPGGPPWEISGNMGFGVNTHLGRMNDYMGAPITEAETTEAMATLGCKYIRQGVEWHIVEKVAGVYDFSLFTNQFAGLAGLNAIPLITLGYGNPVHTAYLDAPPWTVWPPRTAPELAAFQEYCRRTAIVFGPGVPYEIWNEANADGFWGGAASIAEYCKVFDAGARGIRSVHPDAFIMTSGVTPGAGSMSGYIDATEWVIGVLAGITERADAVAWHFYTTGDYAPWDASGWNFAVIEQAPHCPERIIDWLPEVRTALGTALPILNTECGYCISNGGLHYSDARQGVLVSRLMLSSFIAGIDALTIIYDMIDDALNVYDPQGAYGQYDFNFVLKSSGVAMAAVTNAFKNATGAITHNSGGTVYPGQIFTIMIPKADRTVAVAWSNGIAPTSHTITFPAAVTGSKAVDVYGVTQDKVTSGSTVAVNLCNAYGPIIVEANGPGSVADRTTVNLLRHADDLGHADWQRFNLTTFDEAGITAETSQVTDFFGTKKSYMVAGEVGAATAGDSFMFRQADVTGLTIGTAYRFEIDILHHPYVHDPDLITGGDFILRVGNAGFHDITIHNKRGWQRIKMTWTHTADDSVVDIKLTSPTANVWVCNPLLTAEL